MNLTFFLWTAIIATGFSAWSVCFRNRWAESAKKYLIERCGGRGADDDELVESARQSIVRMWLVIAASQWLAVAVVWSYS